MSKTVLLVGHCGPDSSYLKMIVKKAIADVQIVSIDDSASLTHALETKDPGLILFNRELGYGFDPATGVEAIALLRQTNPNLKMILVSNYADAQKAATAAGALPGFGKNELGSPRVLEVLRDAMGASEAGKSPISVTNPLLAASRRDEFGE